MATPTQSPSLSLVPAKSDTIIFSGPPGQLKATLRLQNTSREKAKLSSVKLKAPKLQGLAKQPLEELQIGAKLFPSQQAEIPIVMPLDPITPPGTYEAQIQVGEQNLDVLMHVSEHVALSVEPSNVTIYLDGKVKNSFEHEFVVENLGNIPLPLGDKCMVQLVDSLGITSLLRNGLKDAYEQTTDDVMKSFLCSWADQQAGLVSLIREPYTLEPGKKVIIKGRFELPEDTKPYRHYIADFELFNAVIHLDVYSNGFEFVPTKKLK